MGEAKRRKEAGFSGEKRKPEKGLRGRKSIRATAKLIPVERAKVVVVDGQQYFKDPVSGGLRKVGPKLRRILNARKKKVEAIIDAEAKERFTPKETEDQE